MLMSPEMRTEKATTMRQIIAKNMVNSWQTSPKCDYFVKVDAGRLIKIRAENNNKNDNKISFLCFVMKATAQALKEFPYINSSYDFEQQVHILHEKINIGFAMSTGTGLVVLNVKDVDKLSPLQIENEIARLVASVNNRKLSMDDITGSTLTVNNMGVYERLQYHTAIINQPELAILSIYRIREEPVVRNGNVVVGQVMNMALSADHRVIDGKMAYEFMCRLCELLEAPESILSSIK